MPEAAPQISEFTAGAWSVFGGVVAYLVLFVLPELLRQQQRERKTGQRYRMTPLSAAVGVVVFLAVVGASIGVAQVLDPCKKGDAWMGGLGSVSLVSGLLGLTHFGLRRSGG